MSEAEPSLKRNYRRRAIAAVVCLSPVGLLVASLIASEFMSRESGVGCGLVVCALLPAALNTFLSVIRPVIYRWRHGSLDGLRNVSGVPLIGTLLVVLAGIVSFGDWRVATIGLFVLVFDTGSSLWLLIVTWRDRSFWDA